MGEASSEQAKENLKRLKKCLEKKDFNEVLKTVRDLTMIVYFICNVPIQECNSIKYLGVIIDSRLSWSEHVDAIFHKASQVRGFLQQNLRSCSRDVKLCSYKMYVDPILDYASAVWLLIWLSISTSFNVMGLDLLLVTFIRLAVFLLFFGS